MAEEDFDRVLLKVLEERTQGHETRRALFEKLERELGRPVVTFFTSFVYPVMIENADVDALAGLLQMMDLSNGLALIISSPGGDGLAAERMINVCRSYSGTGDYWIIVPGQAKSAATMVCFGSSRIYMGPTSELGPVDPQVTILDGGVPRVVPVYHIVASYEDLFRRAVNETGRLEPYLQQLARYDASVIQHYKAAIDLAQDISINALASGMMRGLGKEEIRDKINMFLTPETTKTHGRPIFQDRAIECGLAIAPIEALSPIWHLIYELYMRTNHFVSSQMAKCIESRQYLLTAPVPQER